MLMVLGLFPFMLDTLPYQTLERHQSWRHGSTNRVGLRPATQYLGPGDETITLGIKLLPEVTGGRNSLDTLRLMADSGKAWPLVEGTGTFYGLYVATELRAHESLHFQDGAPRQVDATLTLKRVDDDRIDLLATAQDMLSLITG